MWQDVQQVHTQGGGVGWQLQGQECSMQERREVGEGSTCDGR